MKMLNNVLVAGVFEISRTPIQSPQSTKKGEGDSLCAVPRLELPVQVHPPHHHAEDVAVPVAERVDGLEEGHKRKQRHCPWVSQTKNHEIWQTTKTTPKATRGYSPCVPHPRYHRSRQGGSSWSHQCRCRLQHQKKSSRQQRERNGWAKSVRRNGRLVNDRSSKSYVEQVRLRWHLYGCYKKHFVFLKKAQFSYGTWTE